MVPPVAVAMKPISRHLVSKAFHVQKNVSFLILAGAITTELGEVTRYPNLILFLDVPS